MDGWLDGWMNAVIFNKPKQYNNTELSSKSHKIYMISQGVFQTIYDVRVCGVKLQLRCKGNICLKMIQPFQHIGQIYTLYYHSHFILEVCKMFHPNFT